MTEDDRKLMEELGRLPEARKTYSFKDVQGAVDPKFLNRGRSEVVEYCMEEVRRQGHDVHALDGLERVGWMLGAWCCALTWPQGAEINAQHVSLLGKYVEPYKNQYGLRKCEVVVGSSHTPMAANVPHLLSELLSRQAELSPLAFYREFELIHPFEDGNGRAGKVLLNWKNGTLLNSPVFPPADFWGARIANP